MERDHKIILQLLQDYFNGKLGTYFVPPEFFSGIPEVIKPRQPYSNGEKQLQDQIRGENAEKIYV